MSDVVLEELEYSLATRPDPGLLSRYETLVSQQCASDVPRPVWLTRQFLRCLNTDLRDPVRLNELADYYEREMGQNYNATLCRISSLAASPAQHEVYQAVRDAFSRGIMEPPRCEIMEPISCMVSVILATRNRPVALRHAISSVLNQTFQDFELLVINDGGSDEAGAIAESYGSPKIRYFYKETGGHRTAMNLGLRVARGKYIAYLDDDDVYFPKHLETVVASAEADKLDFVCSRNRWVVGKWRDDAWVATQDLTQQEPFSLERLHASAVIADLTVLHRRSLAERVGEFWEEPLRGGEWEYWVRCSHHVPIKRLEAVTGEVRVATPGLPLNQPARACLFTHLWVNYFRSAFGHAILAASARSCNDASAFEEHLNCSEGYWPYLSRRSLELLWDIAAALEEPRSQDVLRQIATFHPAWLLGRLAAHPLSKDRLSVLASLPVANYLSLSRYILTHLGAVAGAQRLHTKGASGG